MPRKKKDERPISEIAMEQFEQFATGVPIESQDKNPARRRQREIKMDQQLMKRLAIKGLSMVLYLCNDGNYRAAQYLVDRCLGSPEAPFTERVQAMSADEAMDALYQQYVEMGYSEAIARDLVAAAAKGQAPDVTPGA